MANLTMDEVWHVKNYFVISTRLRQAGPAQLEMTYSDLIALVSILYCMLLNYYFSPLITITLLFTGNVVNKPEHGSLDWVKICEKSSKVITFIDLAGHERYLKTTVFGMTGHAPDFGKNTLLRYYNCKI